MASGDYIVGRDIDFQYASEPAEPPLARLDGAAVDLGADGAGGAASASKKKRKKRKKKAASDQAGANVSNGANGSSTNPQTSTELAAPAASQKSDIWNTSSEEERQRIREFWTKLGDPERMKLVRLDKDLLLQKVRRQRRDCACSVCGRKREAVEQELEMLYEAYYSELESYSARLLLGGSELANDLEYDEDLLFDSFSAKARPPLKRDDERECKRHPHDHHNHSHHNHNHGHHNHNHNHNHHNHNHHTHNHDAAEPAPAQAQFEIDLPQDMLKPAPAAPLPGLPVARQDAHMKLKQPAAKAAAAAAFKESSQKLANALGPNSPLAGGIISMADDILHNEGKRVLDVMERIENGRLRSDDPQFASLLYESYMQARGQPAPAGQSVSQTIGQAVVTAATATIAAYDENNPEPPSGDDAAELIYKLGFPRNMPIPDFPGMGDLGRANAATEAAAAAVTAAALNGDAPFGGPLELQHIQHLQQLQRTPPGTEAPQKQYLQHLLQHPGEAHGPYDRVIAAAVEEYEDDEYDEYDDEDLDDEDLDDDDDDEDLDGSGYATDDNYAVEPRRHPGELDDDVDDYDDDYDEDYDSGDVDGDDGLTPEAREEQRLQEGRRMLQVFAARMFEQRIMQAYREHVARERQQRLLEELEEESRQAVEREAKKLKDKERKKSKKLAAKQQREEEQRRKEQEEQARAEQQRLKEEQQRQAQRELEKSKAEAHRREIEARMEKMERAAKERELKEREQREKEREEREAKEREARERELKDREVNRETKERELKDRELKDKDKKSESPKTKAKAKAKSQPEPKTDKLDKKPKESKKAKKDKAKTQPVPVPIPIPVQTKSSSPVKPEEDSHAQQQQRLNEHMQGLRMAATSPRASFSPLAFNAQPGTSPSPLGFGMGRQGSIPSPFASNINGSMMGSGLNSVTPGSLNSNLNTNPNGNLNNLNNLNGNLNGNLNNNLNGMNGNLFNPLPQGFSSLSSSVPAVPSSVPAVPSAVPSVPSTTSSGMWSNSTYKPAGQASWGWSPWTPQNASPPPSAPNSMWATSSSLDAIRQTAIASYTRIVRDGLAVDGFVPSQVLYHATVDALGGVSFSQNDMYQACGVTTGAGGDFDCLRDSVGLVTHLRYGRAA